MNNSDAQTTTGDCEDPAVDPEFTSKRKNKLLKNIALCKL